MTASCITLARCCLSTCVFAAVRAASRVASSPARRDSVYAVGCSPGSVMEAGSMSVAAVSYVCTHVCVFLLGIG